MTSLGDYAVSAVPEPRLTLLLAGAACLLGYAWRWRRTGNRALMVGALVSVLICVSATTATHAETNQSISLNTVSEGTANWGTVSATV